MRMRADNGPEESKCSKQEWWHTGEPFAIREPERNGHKDARYYEPCENRNPHRIGIEPEQLAEKQIRGKADAVP